MKIFILFFCLLHLSKAFSQIGINPPAVFIDPSTGSASLSILNKGPEPSEIDICFRFAYQAYDSSGGKSLVYDDSLESRKHSLLPFVKAFPARIKIPPYNESVVRLLVSGMDSLPDGSYWTRIIIRSTRTKPLADKSVYEPGLLKSGFNLVTQVVGIIILQKGFVYSGLDLTGLKACSDSSHVYLDLDMTHLGNSPFWGNIELYIIDQSGNQIIKTGEILSVYTDTRIRFSFLSSLFEKGKSYSASVRIDNNHKDLPTVNRLEKVNFTKHFNFTIP